MFSFVKPKNGGLLISVFFFWGASFQVAKTGNAMSSACREASRKAYQHRELVIPVCVCCAAASGYDPYYIAGSCVCSYIGIFLGKRLLNKVSSTFHANLPRIIQALLQNRVLKDHLDSLSQEGLDFFCKNLERAILEEILQQEEGAPVFFLEEEISLASSNVEEKRLVRKVAQTLFDKKISKEKGSVFIDKIIGRLGLERDAQEKKICLDSTQLNNERKTDKITTLTKVSATIENTETAEQESSDYQTFLSWATRHRNIISKEGLGNILNKAIASVDFYSTPFFDSFKRAVSAASGVEGKEARMHFFFDILFELEHSKAELLQLCSFVEKLKTKEGEQLATKHNIPQSHLCYPILISMVKKILDKVACSNEIEGRDEARKYFAADRATRFLNSEKHKKLEQTALFNAFLTATKNGKVAEKIMMRKYDLNLDPRMRDEEKLRNFLRGEELYDFNNFLLYSCDTCCNIYWPMHLVWAFETIPYNTEPPPSIDHINCDRKTYTQDQYKGELFFSWSKLFYCLIKEASKNNFSVSWTRGYIKNFDISKDINKDELDKFAWLLNKIVNGDNFLGTQITRVCEMISNDDADGAYSFLLERVKKKISEM